MRPARVSSPRSVLTRQTYAPGPNRPRTSQARPFAQRVVPAEERGTGSRAVLPPFHSVFAVRDVLYRAGEFVTEMFVALLGMGWFWLFYENREPSVYCDHVH